MIANLQAHYGFSRMPFTASIPISSLYASAAHKEAVARLRWLISAIGNPRYQKPPNTQPASWWEQGTRTLAGDRAAFWPARSARSGSPA
jgi:hypothetical protein